MSSKRYPISDGVPYPMEPLSLLRSGQGVICIFVSYIYNTNAYSKYRSHFGYTCQPHIRRRGETRESGPRSRRGESRELSVVANIQRTIMRKTYDGVYK